MKVSGLVDYISSCHFVYIHLCRVFYKLAIISFWMCIIIFWSIVVIVVIFFILIFFQTKKKKNSIRYEPSSHLFCVGEVDFIRFPRRIFTRKNHFGNVFSFICYQYLLATLSLLLLMFVLFYFCVLISAILILFFFFF